MDNLSILKKLDFSSNQIKEIEVRAFRNLTLLETLAFEYNEISALKEDVFIGLKSLGIADKFFLEDLEKCSGNLMKLNFILFLIVALFCDVILK